MRPFRLSSSAAPLLLAAALLLAGCDGPTPTQPNTRPALQSARLEPAAPRSDEPLTVVTGQASDADGDAVILRYRWFVDGTQLQGQDGATLPAGTARRDQHVFVDVAPFDGKDEGTAVRTDTVALANGVPAAPTVSISQHETRYDLSCDVITPATDTDGDTLSLEFRWLLGGEATAFTGAQLPGNEVYVGDAWTCQVRASDGAATSPWASDMVQAE